MRFPTSLHKGPLATLDAAVSEQKVLLGKEISAQWAIVVYYKMPGELLTHNL